MELLLPNQLPVKLISLPPTSHPVILQRLTVAHAYVTLFPLL